MSAICNLAGGGERVVHSLSSLLLQAYDARQAQATMDSFLAFNERFAKIKYALFSAPLMLLRVIKACLRSSR